MTTPTTPERGRDGLREVMRRVLDDGRRLASRRDDLIAAGIDPAELVVPTAPDNDTCWCDGPDCGQTPCIEVAAPPASDVDSDNAAAGGAEEVDALSDFIATARDEYPRLAGDMDSGELAERILASDWLAAHVAQAERRGEVRALREAAVALPWTDAVPAWLRDRADRIEGTR